MVLLDQWNILMSGITSVMAKLIITDAPNNSLNPGYHPPAFVQADCVGEKIDVH
ncbi:hypothetical protein NPIL_33831, partial [Nephila pilipes]